MNLAAACLGLAAMLLLPSSAQATIVWEGKEVPAWPDLVLPMGDPGISVPHALASTIHLFPHPTGVVKGLTILVDFSDAAATLSKDEIDAWLNTKGYNKYGLTGSIRDYYLGQSNGIVDFQNEVHGYYRAQKPKSYYQGGTAYERADELWAEVIPAMDAEIDFSLFDNDKDGRVDAISLLYAGTEGTFGVGLWPHASASNLKKDGVTLSRYMMTALRTQPTNYVFAHENGHMLFGWPDLYGVGDYCIMANRDSDANPVGINDVFRVDQGWLDVVDVDANTNASYTAIPDASAYRFLNPARSNEYFLWSNIQPTQEWVSIKGGGLLLWHFDKSISSNTPPNPLQLAVVQGGGTRVLSATTWPSPGTAATDFFYKGNNSEFSGTTKPASLWNNGSSSGLRIYDIGANGGQIGFSVGTGSPPLDAGQPGADAARVPDAGLRDASIAVDARVIPADTAIVATGGNTATGGTTATGGRMTTGGRTASGGTTAMGGVVGGNSTGGSPGPATTGGQSASGGTVTGSGGFAGNIAVGSGSVPTVATAGGVAPKTATGNAGCACSVRASTRPSAASGMLLLFAALAVLCRRRRVQKHDRANWHD